MMELSEDNSVVEDEEEEEEDGVVVVGVSTAARRLECNDRYDVDDCC